MGMDKAGLSSRGTFWLAENRWNNLKKISKLNYQALLLEGEIFGFMESLCKISWERYLPLGQELWTGNSLPCCRALGHSTSITHPLHSHPVLNPQPVWLSLNPHHTPGGCRDCSWNPPACSARLSPTGQGRPGRAPWG